MSVPRCVTGIEGLFWQIFEGSNDGETWTKLDTQVAQVNWTSTEVKTFTVNVLQPTPLGYTRRIDHACSNQTLFQDGTVQSVNSCAAACSSDHSCISFQGDWRAGDTSCYLSTSCTQAVAAAGGPNPDWDLYTKDPKKLTNSSTGTNIASQAMCGVPFGSSSNSDGCVHPGEGLGAGCGIGSRCWGNINDEQLGQDSAWIPGARYDGNFFVGVRFASAMTINGFRISRDGTDEPQKNRVGGRYELQYTTVEEPGYTTGTSNQYTADIMISTSSGDFAAGDVITGTNSNATATIVSADPTFITVTNETGSFLANETIAAESDANGTFIAYGGPWISTDHFTRSTAGFVHYELTPPLANVTGVRLVVNQRHLAIDELEVYSLTPPSEECDASVSEICETGRCGIPQCTEAVWNTRPSNTSGHLYPSRCGEQMQFYQAHNPAAGHNLTDTCTYVAQQCSTSECSPCGAPRIGPPCDLNRCGSDFENKLCNCTSGLLYCDVSTGWCVDNAAQSDTTYDCQPTEAPTEAPKTEAPTTAPDSSASPAISISLSYTSSGTPISFQKNGADGPVNTFQYGPISLSTTSESASIDLSFTKSYSLATVSVSTGNTLEEASESVAVYMEAGQSADGMTSIALELNKQKTILITAVNPLSGASNCRFMSKPSHWGFLAHCLILSPSLGDWVMGSLAHPHCLAVLLSHSLSHPHCLTVSLGLRYLCVQI